MMPRSLNRLHDRRSFFKYTSVATAKLVLNNRALRWSSPSLFNDPFDVPRELLFGIAPTDISNALTKRFTSLIENPPDDTSELQPKLRVIIDTAKHAASPVLQAKMIAALEETAREFKSDGTSLEALRQLWRSWIPEFRILCLTESPERVSMWFHYADQYKGAVLEFICDDELDSAWLAALPVRYSADKPEVYEADGWATLLMMPLDIAIKKLLHVSTYTKSPDWSYENEWRITSFKRPGDVGLYTDYRFNPREVAGVYLGPLITLEDRSALVACAEDFPNVRVFEVSLGMNRSFAINKIRG